MCLFSWIKEFFMATKKVPQLTKRVVTVSLPPEYDGFEFDLWVNAPTKSWEALQARPVGDEEIAAELAPALLDEATEEEVQGARAAVVARNEAHIAKALRSLIIAHNGWLNFDGEPFPDAQDDSFYEEIPTELMVCMLAAAQEAQKKLGRSMMKTRRR